MFVFVIVCIQIQAYNNLSLYNNVPRHSLEHLQNGKRQNQSNIIELRF